MFSGVFMHISWFLVDFTQGLHMVLYRVDQAVIIHNLLVHIKLKT